MALCILSSDPKQLRIRNSGRKKGKGEKSLLVECVPLNNKMIVSHWGPPLLWAEWGHAYFLDFVCRTDTLAPRIEPVQIRGDGLTELTMLDCWASLWENHCCEILRELVTWYPWEEGEMSVSTLASFLGLSLVSLHLHSSGPPALGNSATQSRLRLLKSVKSTQPITNRQAHKPTLIETVFPGDSGCSKWTVKSKHTLHE